MMTILPYVQQLSQGVALTVILMLCILAVGLLFAFIMTLISLSDRYVLKKLINGVIFFVRGTPMLVQIFLIYYGSGQFEWIRESFMWVFFRSPMSCAIFALGLNTACYTTVLFRGAMASVPHNQISAAYAMGMSKWQAIRRIIFPQAFRVVLPAYSNEIIIILKSTSLASTITIMELMGVTQQLIALTYDPVRFYLIAGIIYLMLNAFIISLFKFLQFRFKVPNLTH